MSEGIAHRQRVAVVTGGGGGIGAAIAEQLGRAGTFVITLDPLVSVDGATQLPDPEETTAERILAAGGSARASTASVTDREGVRSLFAEIAEEFGGLDAVVNVAGITRPVSFMRGSEDDWSSLLSVHLDGYRNVLDAALPLMAEVGRGHILGVTSGSGWRPADTGAYGCAKRAVASLTWQLGRHAPPGVVVNAISPIAMTRMVTAALSRRTPSQSPGPAPDTSKASSTGGLSLGSMPTPEQLGPLAAHLVSDGFDSCRGQVLFTAGSEMAIVEPPALLEVLGTEMSSLAHALEVVCAGAFVPAERGQGSTGGSNPRFAALLADLDAVDLPHAGAASCLVVSDRDDVASAVAGALGSRGVDCRRIEPPPPNAGFAGAADALASTIERHGAVDAVVLAVAGSDATTSVDDWRRVLAEHDGIVEGLHVDAAWSRAVAEVAVSSEATIRLVTVTDAVTAGGRSRAQASAQLARSARGATDDQVASFSVSLETSGPDAMASVAALTAHLLCSPEMVELSGAELVVGPGSVGLRSHPRVGASVVLGDSTVPPWLDGVLEGMVR